MVDGELYEETDVGGAEAVRARADERVDAVVMGRSAEALLPRNVGLAGAAVATAVGVGRRCAGVVVTCRDAGAAAGCAGRGRPARVCGCSSVVAELPIARETNPKKPLLEPGSSTGLDSALANTTFVDSATVSRDA